MNKIVINRDELDNWCYEHGILNPLDTSIINYTEVIEEKEELKAMPRTAKKYFELLTPIIEHGEHHGWIETDHTQTENDDEYIYLYKYIIRAESIVPKKQVPKGN